MYDANTVILYIKKDQSEIKYLDVAARIAGFVFKRPDKNQVISILFKLTTPLEELKRFGFPVDRLLEMSQQQSHSKLFPLLRHPIAET
jgi:hypothetical protein